MDSINIKENDRPFEDGKGQKNARDRHKAPFRVPSVPHSPSSAPLIIPGDKQLELARQRNATLGNPNDPWIPTTIPVENKTRQVLCPPPLIRLESSDQHSSEFSLLEVGMKNRDNSSTSTPILSNKKASLGGLIRPIPSRLGSPFSPILTPGTAQSPAPSHVLATNLASSAVNPFSPKFLVNNDITSLSKSRLSVDNGTINGQNLSIKSECATKVGSVDDYDSAFEDESIQHEEESCSRTTPNNHKSIRKWRQHSHPGGVKNISKPNTIYEPKLGDFSNSPNSFFPPSPFQPISIRTSSTVINETSHSSLRSPFDIDVHRLSPAGPLSAPSTFHWGNPGGSLSHRRPNSTGGSTGSSSGCSSFLSGGPFSPNESLFASPGSNASSNGHMTSISSTSSASLSNPLSIFRDHDSSIENDQHVSPYSGVQQRQSSGVQHKTPIFRRTTTTVLTKTETVTSPEGSIAEENADMIQESVGEALPNINHRNSINSVTTSSGTIPIGIAVARQRTSAATSSSTNPNVERNVAFTNDSAINLTANSNINVAQNLVKIASKHDNSIEHLRNSSVHSDNDKLPCANAVPNNEGILRSLQVTHPYYSPWSQFPYLPGPTHQAGVTGDSFALQSAAAAATLAATAGLPPLGGYQLTRHPLTGQVYFVPSAFNAPTQPHHMMWPPEAIAAAVHQLSTAAAVSGPPSIPTTPLTYQAGISPHQHSSFLEQWQRETQLISAIARNYQDPSQLSAFTSPADSPLIKAQESKKIDETTVSKSQEIQSNFPESDMIDRIDSGKRRSSGEISKRLYDTDEDAPFNDTTNDRKCYKNSIVLKTDPYQEGSSGKDSKRFQINEPCQINDSVQIKTKVEPINLHTKREVDMPLNLSGSRMADRISTKSADDDRVSVGSAAEYSEYNETSPTADRVLHTEDKHNYKFSSIPNIRVESCDNNPMQYFKESQLKVEKPLPSVKAEIPMTESLKQSLKCSMQNKEELKENEASSNMKKRAQKKLKAVDDNKKAINKNFISNSSHTLITEYNNKSGLDILAEGVERLEGKLELLDDSKHVDSRPSSPDQFNLRLHCAPLSPLGMLCDAAVLKAEEDERTTPIKIEMHGEFKSGGNNVKNGHLNVSTGSTGRSRSLDIQKERTMERRNSLCVSSEFGRGYRSPKAERDVKAFIASRSIKPFNFAGNNYTVSTKENYNNEKTVLNGMSTLSGLDTKELKIDNGKSSENMASWENDMRTNMASIQKEYKEKYKALYRLEHQTKRLEAWQKKRPSVSKEGGETSTSMIPSKLPVTSSRKHYHTNANDRTNTKSNALPLPHSTSLPLPLHPDILDAQEKVINKLKEQECNKEKNPITKMLHTNNQLKPHSNAIHSRQNEDKVSQSKKQVQNSRMVPIQNFVRPSISRNPSVVEPSENSMDLSTITSKFKVSKPNPFENLLRLSSKSNSSANNTVVSVCLKPNGDNETMNGSLAQNEQEIEADPIEETIIIPLKEPTRVKDVVNSNDDFTLNSIYQNKEHPKFHHRKRMIETYVLKKPNTSFEINTKPNSNHQQPPSAPGVRTGIKEGTNLESHNTKKAATNIEHKRNDNVIRVENIRRNFAQLPDVTTCVSSTSQVITSSNLKLKLKQTACHYKEHNGIDIRENKEHTMALDNSFGSNTKERSYNLNDSTQPDFTTDEVEDAQRKRKKKAKKSKSKKAKKEKHEEKRSKNTKKKMKVIVGRTKENCLDIADEMNQNNRTIQASLTAPKSAVSFSESESPPIANACVLKESDLDEGIRVLVKLDGHFYPGKILAISPPDIYGILVDRERGNRPHIFSREEVLKEAIFEVEPQSLLDLPKGTRVCAYWSGKYHHLYPGTVGDDIRDDISNRRKSSKDQNYVNIELDDGDDRDIHIKQIRFLPPNYPLVTCENDPLSSVSRRRRRQSFENFQRPETSKCITPRGSIEDVAMGERIAVAKRARYETEKVDKSPTKAIPNKPITERKEAIGRLKFTIKTTSASQTSHSNKVTYKTSSKQLKCPESSSHGQQNAPKQIIMHASRSELSGKDAHSRQNVVAKKGNVNTDSQQEQSMGMAAFLPAQQLWRWSSKGHKRARGRTLHREIERDEDEKLAVGDCAIFLSTGRPDRPYVGRLESLWETSSGQMRVKVQWFYHASETEGTAPGGRRVDDLKMAGALFESSHFDENDIQTISHRCEVLPYSVYAKKIESDPSRLQTIYENNDLYYLAGQHDPIEGTIHFENDVLESQ